jgi:hypothetical protein
MAKAAKPKYRGVLAKPMKLDDGFEATFDDYIERVAALFEHYNIAPGDPTAWMELAMRLAHSHVPGVRWKAGRGSNKAMRDYQLFGEVFKLTEQGHSAKRAAQLVVQKHPQLGFKSAEAARVRFEQLSNKDAPDRGNARANVLALIAAAFERKL